MIPMNLSEPNQPTEKYLNNAQQHFLLGSYTTALFWVEQALSLNPQLVEAWEKKAETLRKLNRYEEANTAFEKAIKIRSRAFTKPKTTEDDTYSLEYFENLAAHSIELGRFKEAVAAQENAIHTNVTKTDVEDWLNLGDQQLIVQDFEGAIASYDQALHYKPDFHEAWNSRGTALSILGDFEGAVASY
jgi:tetratricopeptide (TPR) repeat protein